MLFDLTPVAVVLLCLVPGRALAPLLRWSIGLRWFLAIPILAAARVMPPLACTLLHAFLLLNLIAIWRHPGHRLRWLAMLLLAASALAWPLELVLIYEWQPGGSAPTWTLDLANRYVRTVAAWLPGGTDAAVMGSALEQVASAMTGWSARLLSLTFALGFPVTAALYEMVRAKVPDLPERAPTLASRAPRIALVASAAALLAPRFAPASVHWWLTLVAQLPLGLFLATGAWSLYLLGASRAAGRAAFGALLLVSLLEPRIAYAIAAFGVIDSALALTERVERRSPSVALARARVRAAGVAMRTWIRPAPVSLTLGTVLGALFVSAVHPAIPYPGDPPVPGPIERLGATADRVTLATPELRFAIDRFEAPNRAGALPTVGLSPREAEAACRARGLELCTRRQWALACSEHDRHDFFVEVPEGQHGMRAARRHCNLGRGHATRTLPDLIAPHGKLVPAGAGPGCTNPLGMFDMVGNAAEWVRLEGEPPGFYALAGGYYGTTDAITVRCSRPSMVHERQLFAIDLEAVSFRCCGAP